MKDDTPFEPDRVEGAPHPRHAAALHGHLAARATLAEAARGGRMHHAWLIAGPRGIGKATFAWRAAAALIAGNTADHDLSPPPDHPALARIAALSEPRLYLMRPTRHPETGTPRRQITIDVARGLKSFLAHRPAEGGHRVVIVDAADDMTVQAANALLKGLEEPPAETTFLIVSHAPARLLPTIRSRCRTLTLGPLSPPDLAAALEGAGAGADIDAVALSQLAQGSAGEAMRLLEEDGPETYAALIRIFSRCPDIDRQGLIALGDNLAGATNQGRLDVVVRLIGLFLHRLARQGAGMPPGAEAATGEAAILGRMSPDPKAARAWADLHASAMARLAHGRAVNLDPSALVLDTGVTINDTGRETVRG